MRLLRVGLRGFRRFRDEYELDVAEKLVAIVGPNEAGKSSLLEALEWFGERDTSIDASQVSRVTEGVETRVWARFAIDDGDREALQPIREAAGLHQVVVIKRADGQHSLAFEPEVSRDLEPRQRVLRALERARNLRWTAERPEDDPFVSGLARGHDILSSDVEEIDASEVDELRQIAEAIRSEPSRPASLVGLPDTLQGLTDHEAPPPPRERARLVLLGRMPRFVKFRDDDRNLRHSYNFDEEVNPALTNLLDLAGLNWGALEAASHEEGQGRLKGDIEAAAARLAGLFEEWTQQPGLVVSFNVIGRDLYPLVRMEARPDYLNLTQHSDGLRQFVALRAYLGAEKESPAPVLLIDEAEAHLHYDAQGDLIRVFGDQTQASKVIYTTHSAGCLPPDLGAGLRMVLPVKEEDEAGALRDTDRSKVVNWSWSRELPGVGFSPVLFGMGASTFAFAATRKALIAEGPSDALLLPTLFREVTGRDYLDFQVVPNLSTVSADALGELDFAAAHVGYVVDGDQGGEDLRTFLVDNGVPADRILMIGRRQDNLELEDLLDARAYVDAVNANLEEWYGPAIRMPVSAMPTRQRWDAVEAWCAGRPGVDRAPGKPEIAMKLLDVRGETSLVAEGRRGVLERLFAQVEVLLS